jgi:hypothetical protein
MVMVRDGSCHRALDNNFSQYASLLLRNSKLSTIEQLGQVRATTLVRVRVRARATVRVRYRSRLNALWPTSSSYITTNLSLQALG